MASISHFPSRLHETLLGFQCSPSFGSILYLSLFSAKTLNLKQKLLLVFQDFFVFFDERSANFITRKALPSDFFYCLIDVVKITREKMLPIPSRISVHVQTNLSR
ncbi:hypothetical protein B1750_gp382 [Noumeavirus]|uniref:hypothetical protein n=1 Tax=Noumeavirus TaxID=1955558 RepID=UPI000982C6BE|nr:hypothetical protein B1750_gp382 [Noumeavirus]AQM73363.1 hypothetical protein NMV_382 [Noumeavirus]